LTPILSFCNIESNVTKNLREERKIVSYPPLGLADITVRPIVVH
jgi:hypothetical protein